MNIISIKCHLKSVHDNLLLIVSFEIHINNSEVNKNENYYLDVSAELDEKQQEILDSGHMMITNIHVDDKGLTHCEIFGF